MSSDMFTAPRPDTAPVLPDRAEVVVVAAECVHRATNTYAPGIGLEQARAGLEKAARDGWLAPVRYGQSREAVVLGHNLAGERLAPPAWVVPNRRAFEWLRDRLNLRPALRGCDRCDLMGGAE